MKKGYQHKLAVIFNIILILSTLTACGENSDENESGSQSYITESNVELPGDVTNISRFIIHNDIAYICAKSDGSNSDGSTSYIASMELDGSNFQQITENQGDTNELMDFVIDKNNNIWAVCMSSESLSLLQFSDTGILQQSIDISSVIDDSIQINNSNHYFLNLDTSGNLYVTIFQTVNDVYVFDSQGQFLFNVQDERQNTISTITTTEGKVAVCAGDGSGDSDLMTIDVESQDWAKDKIDLGEVAGIYEGDEIYSFYIFDSSDFYGYNAETGSMEKIFIWSDVGLSTGDTHMCVLSDGKFAALTGTFSQTGLYSYEITVLELGEDTRKVLTMTSIQTDPSVLEAVSQFNKTSKEYRIALTQYFSSYENVSDDDFSNAITNFNLEIISGNIPDIVDLGNMPVETYYNKGLLEDLYPYIENDPYINMDAYYKNAFDAFSIDGGLPYVTNGVAIYTMIADSSVVGMDSGWTYSDVSSLSEQYNITIGTSEFFLEKIIKSDNSYIDWSAQKCFFDTSDFTELLEMVNKCVNNDSSISTAASFEAILSVYQVAEYNTTYQGNANAIGLPNTEGTTYHALLASAKIGMSATSENKEGAWSFVKTFLEEKQQEESYYIPISKYSFEKVMQETMNGNSMWSSMFDTEITQNDIDFLEDILSNAYYSISDDQSVSEIVNEEASAYFSGSQSVERTADNIQDRVQTYIYEQS